MSDWRWFQAFLKGDDDLARELRRETDRSLKRDPDRWASKHVSDTKPHSGREPGGRDAYTADYDRRHQGDKNQGGKGHARNEWGQAQYDDARRDLERQQRGERAAWQEQGDRRSLRDVARDLRDQRRDPDRDARREARREAARDVRRENAARAREARDDYRQGKPPPGFTSW